MKKISLAVFAMMMVAMLAVFAGCSSMRQTQTAVQQTQEQHKIILCKTFWTRVLWYWDWTTVSHQWASVMKTTIL